MAVRGDTLEVNVIFSEFLLKSSKHLLLIMCRSGVYPFSLSQLKQYFQASAIDLSCPFFNGTDMMAFES